MKSDPLDLVKRKLLSCRNLAVTSHLRPDGDSICTGLALYFIGESLGINVSFINRDKTPFPFDGFPDSDKIRIGQIMPDRYDAVILLECANVTRSGQENLDGYFTINIDHHHSNDYYADINWVQPEAAAVACLIYDLAENLNIPFTPKLSTLLYSAVVSDTGSFQFSNTDARSLDLCSRLIRNGAEPARVSELIFHNYSPDKIRLLGRVLSTIQLNDNGTIGIISMFKKDLDDLHLKEIDTEDITTLARSIKGLQVVLFFKEMAPDTYRVSIRSKGAANSAAIAEYFGGGGHLHAAGFTAMGPYQEVIREIPASVERLLRECVDEAE